MEGVDAIVKRFPGTKAGLGTLGLSLIVLGMLDNAALTPMASVAAAGRPVAGNESKVSG